MELPPRGVPGSKPSLFLKIYLANSIRVVRGLTKVPS